MQSRRVGTAVDSTNVTIFRGDRYEKYNIQESHFDLLFFWFGLSLPFTVLLPKKGDNFLGIHSTESYIIWLLSIIWLVCTVLYVTFIILFLYIILEIHIQLKMSTYFTYLNIFVNLFSVKDIKYNCNWNYIHY